MVIYNLKENRENKINKLRINEKGVTLILITLILVISSVLALALITYYQTAALTSEVEAYRMQALYLAEAGANRFIELLSNGTNLTSHTETITFFAGVPGNYTGRFTVSYTPDTLGNHIIISSGIVPIGKSWNTERIIRVEVDTSYTITSWEELTKMR